MLISGFRTFRLQTSQAVAETPVLTIIIRMITMPGMEGESPYRVVCEARIVGEFQRYRAGNVSRLGDGQVWQQESQ
jgi:hypothetical protein